MIKIKTLVSALALITGAPLAAASMTAEQVGMQPMTGLSAGDYVNKAADGDMYEIQSSQVALQRSKNKMVRDHAQTMIRDHTKSSDMLKAAAAKSSPPMSPPPAMTPEKQAKVDALRAAPEADFDRMYIADQVTAHQEAWAVHQGYATTGSEAPLKATAGRVVPVVERHLAHLKSMKM
jgi:putative membrane protein